MKKILNLFFVAMTVFTISNSKPSEAAVGALVGGPFVLIGLITVGAGGVVAAIPLTCAPNCKEGAIAVLFLGAIIAAVGLVVLDGEQPFAFSELSASEAKNLGINAHDLDIYHSELEQANALVKEVTYQLSKVENQKVEDSARAWSSVEDLVSSETFSVMRKIANQK